MRQIGKQLTAIIACLDPNRNTAASQLQKTSPSKLSSLMLGRTQPKITSSPCQVLKPGTHLPLTAPPPALPYKGWQQPNHSNDLFLAAKPEQVANHTTWSSQPSWPEITDFIFIQESHIDFLNLIRANHYWTVIYPMAHHNMPAKTRSVILINKLISKNSWRQVPLHSSNVTIA